MNKKRYEHLEHITDQKWKWLPILCEKECLVLQHNHRHLDNDIIVHSREDAYRLCRILNYYKELTD